MNHGFCFFCSNYYMTQMWNIILQLIQPHASLLLLKNGAEAEAQAAER